MKNFVSYSCKTVLSLALLIGSPDFLAAAECGFAQKFAQDDEGGTRKVNVYQSRPMGSNEPIRVLVYVTYLKVNTDGTRISYHENDPRGTRCEKDPTAKPCAINNIRNAYRNHRRPVSEFEHVRDAGYPSPRTWRVLSENIIEKDKRTGKPCITKDGYLVSMTADVAIPGGYSREGDCDQSKWIDALTVPGVVLPRGPKINGIRHQSKFQKHGVKKRSLAIGMTPRLKNTSVVGIVGDIGPFDELGEANIAYNRTLNSLPVDAIPAHRQDAKDRFQVKKAATIVVPGRHYLLARPLSAGSVATNGNQLLAELGGVELLRECIREEIDSDF